MIKVLAKRGNKTYMVEKDNSFYMVTMAKKEVLPVDDPDRIYRQGYWGKYIGDDNELIEEIEAILSEKLSEDKSDDSSVDLTARQWNHMIRLVNENHPREDAEKFFNKEEMKVYDKVKKQLDDMRKTDPGFCFWPVESDW